MLYIAEIQKLGELIHLSMVYMPYLAYLGQMLEKRREVFLP